MYWPTAFSPVNSLNEATLTNELLFYFQMYPMFACCNPDNFNIFCTAANSIVMQLDSTCTLKGGYHRYHVLICMICPIYCSVWTCDSPLQEVDSHCLGSEGKPRTHYTHILCLVNPSMSDSCRAVFIEYREFQFCNFYVIGKQQKCHVMPHLP